MNKGHQDKSLQSKFDLHKVDYDWIAKNKDVKELKKAYNALKEDGYFPDLLKTCGERICEFQPSFKKQIGDECDRPQISADEQKQIFDDLNTFFDSAKQTDKELRQSSDTQSKYKNQENQSIFSNGIAIQNQALNSEKSPLAEKIERQNMAENERLKGNEYMKSKDYREAVNSYTKSIDFDANQAFTFANRAMAYLKMKSYRQCIDDANQALELKPGYLKAIHRRGKALAALHKYEEAIKDFQQILEEEPDNKDVNKDLMDARTLLKEELKKYEKENNSQVKEEQKPEVKKNEFVRVAIEEDSDEESEPIIKDVNQDKLLIQDVTDNKPRNNIQKTIIKSKFPLKSVKEIEEHSREAKILMKQGGIDFIKKFEEWKQKTDGKPVDDITPDLIEEQEITKEINKSEDELVVDGLKQAAEVLKSDADRLRQEEKEVDKKNQEIQQKIKDAQDAIEKAKAEAEKVRKEQKELEDQLKKKEQDLQKAQAKKEEAKIAVSEKIDSALENMGLSKSDSEKKQKQKGKIDLLLGKVENKKTEAAEQFKLGQYGDAIKTYKKAAESLESAIDDFPLFEQELNEAEAIIFNNLAACCKKELNSKSEVEYTTKVIERSRYITDRSILLKAYLRRGLAFEAMEKYLQAREDMLTAKEIQFENKAASQCLNRCQKAIKDIYGDKVPEVKKNPKVVTAEKKVAAPVTEIQQSEAKKEAPKQEQPKSEPKKESVQSKSAEFNDKFLKIKDEGNEEYKAKSYLMAVAKFTEGISIYEKNKQLCHEDKDILVKVTQLYTNRALAWHMLNDQDQAFTDAHYVIQNLDKTNSKALFRRAHSYKLKGEISKAVADLELLLKNGPKNVQAEKDLIELKSQLKSAQQVSAPSNLGQPLIQEVDQPVLTQPVKQEEKSETQSEEKKKNILNKTKLIDQETLLRSQERAVQEATQQAMQTIPKTAAGLFKDFKQLSKDPSLVYQYMAKIPSKSIQQIYKTSEVESEVLTGILNACLLHGVDNQQNCEITSQIMMAFSKADNFEITAMLLDEKDKKNISAIIDKLKAHIDKQNVTKIQSAFQV